MLKYYSPRKAPEKITDGEAANARWAKKKEKP